MYTLMANCFNWFRKRKEPKRFVTLVIIGLDDAGKTTMVTSLQGEPPDGITPTIGFANAEFTINKCRVTVYDLGGGVRIRDVWRKYYAEVFGVVFVLDSCNADRLDETKDVFCKVVEHAKILGKPFLIFANKQDKEGALPAEDISNALDLEKQSMKYSFPYKVFTCSALKGYGRSVDKNINAGFQWLLNTISSEYGKISARVEHDVTIQREEEEIEKKARMERIRKIREERDRLEREAGRDPDKEDSDEEVMIANPFQPIGKHLENVKSKERRKKIDKEKKQRLDQAKIEMEQPNEDNTATEVLHVKKRKKKKKKIVKQEEEESPKVEESLEGNVDQFNQDPEHTLEQSRHSPDIDKPTVVKKKKKVRKKRRDNDDLNANSERVTVSAAEDEDHILEELHDLGNEGDIMVVKKKKKKSKARQENASGEDEPADPAPIVKKVKKKKKIMAIEEEEHSPGIKHDTDTELKLDHAVSKIDQYENVHVDGADTAENSEAAQDKKPKIKKKKKKRNRTFPIDSVPEEDNASQSLPAPVWKTTATNWTSLPPIANNGDSNGLGGLPPLRSNKGKKALAHSALHAPESPSWARTRPNSEDTDILT